MYITTLLTKLEGINTHYTRKKGGVDITFVDNWGKFKEITSLKCHVRKLIMVCVSNVSDRNAYLDRPYNIQGLLRCTCMMEIIACRLWSSF